jgi:hypothetical protein
MRVKPRRESINHSIDNFGGTQNVVETGMHRVGEDTIGESELLHIVQPLENGRVQKLKLESRELLVPIEPRPQNLVLAVLPQKIHVALLDDDLNLGEIRPGQLIIRFVTNGTRAFATPRTVDDLQHD